MDVDTRDGTSTTSGCPLSYPFNRPSAIELPPVYTDLRADTPVAEVTLPSGDRGYVVSRYDDAKLVLADPRFSRAAMAADGAPRLTPVPMPPNSLFSTDPPEHTRLRKLVTGEFTRRRITALEPRIQEMTDELLDTMAANGGPVDLNPALAFPLPVGVICELLGVPFEDREKFREWSNAIVSLTSHTPEQMIEQRMQMAGYLYELIGRRADEPGEDLLSALIQAHQDRGALDEGELIVMAMTLLVAGHETTVSMIGACVLTLLRHPEILAEVVENPGRVDAMLDELLRVNPIGDGGPLRITLEDVEIAGTVIPKGSAVLAAVCSANRDEKIFDRPDEFVPGREHNPHLAFGHGIHHCLGASLARSELRITIESLFRRFPTLRLAAPVEELRMKSGMLVHGLERLPVTW
ncbi:MULTISPECIES: cytochrome P450 [Pseudonocardia]|uniref:Cytochrome P450 107B1 n=2 Tax=Pseudonocardia TaxID=1847 RepID=A0A1Y2N5R3_PSEAH|nr:MULTISPECIES: cytochrome P450 [Pseudonocardia]OSY42804.1 Cytochrome P450 107B1 [Pseudonocardia autotrophica]TDN77381.1 nocardicin N-oxygenase [Pseudonocardia autotrophica]BBG01404.1 cytochrome P450 [Pseudonocardia autotrophica]GEC24460.1 cytochrome P450 [Pseudonocardia saturnea]